MQWTIPDAPPAGKDPAPRGYIIAAAGTGPADGTLLAVTPQPLVAYPGSAPCPVADTAETAIDRPVRIRVLAND